MHKPCRHCLTGFEGRGWFHTSACRKRAWRRRKAGLPESAYREGGHRGRVPLGELTEKEKVWRALAANTGTLRW